MRTLYLHIGTEKTGTTSIQNFVDKNRRVLTKNGYHVLECSGKKNQRSIAAYCMADNFFDDFFHDKRIDTLEKKQRFRKKLHKIFHKEMNSLGRHIHSVIITSEHFHSRLKKVEDVERLKELTADYFSNIVIICYLREQSALASSLYSTGIKYGTNMAFGEFLQDCTPKNPYYNYNTLLERWSRAFPSASLNVRIFSRDEFYNQDLIDDFCMAINEELLDFTDRKIDVENESFSNIGIIIGRALNSISSRYKYNGAINKERKKAIEQIARSFSGHENNLTMEQYEQIFKLFQYSNQKVAQAYFKGRDPLFPWKPKQISGTPVKEDQITTLANIINDFKGGSVYSKEDINLFRDAAVLLEDIDIRLAYKLMKKAEKGRPNGPFIKQKVKEYEQRL